jgi:HPt (histidine-containing phosphotransfer) domain-containing protein
MSERLNQYFAAEATEYLNQLEALLRVAGPPDADQLMRLATGVRGSAKMAGAETVAGVAERLEDAARSLVNGSVAWSDAFRRLSQQTVADLKLLIRALNRWGQDEERRVREAILRWDDLEGQTVTFRPPPTERSSATPAASLRPAVSISQLYFDDEGPHIVVKGTPPPAPASVSTLLFRGAAALEAAAALRPSVLTAASAHDPHLEELLVELFDLLELSLTPEPSEV